MVLLLALMDFFAFRMSVVRPFAEKHGYRLTNSGYEFWDVVGIFREYRFLSVSCSDPVATRIVARIRVRIAVALALMVMFGLSIIISTTS